MTGELNGAETIAVLIVEPEIWRRIGITQVLSAETALSVTARDRFETLLDADRERRFDVILVPYTIIRQHTIAVVPRIASAQAPARLLFYGDGLPTAHIGELLCAGAKGYVPVDGDPDAIARAVAVVASGSVWAPRRALAAALDRRHAPRRTESLESDPVSATELRILQMLRDGLANKEIAARLGLAEVTVKAHLGKLFRRFRVKTRLQLLAYAIRHHIVLDRHSA